MLSALHRPNMRLNALLTLACLTLFALGCDDEPTAGGPDAGEAAPAGAAAQEMDMGDPAPLDVGLTDLSAVDQGPQGGEPGLDLGPVDQGPPCGLEPTCERGYRCLCPDDEPQECACVASQQRRCDSEDDCRLGERCEAHEGERLCWLAPESLSATLCPGEGCVDDQEQAGPLLVGASSRSITPLGFEVATPEGLDGVHMNFTPPVDPMSGLWRDCGYDGLCPGDEGYEGPDRGEGDRQTQGAFIAGFSHGRPAQRCPEELIGCDRPECCISALAHDELLAQVVVLRRGARTVGFVALDLVGFFHTEVERVKRALQADLSLDLDLLIIASTHTHESFDTVGQYGAGTLTPLKTGVDPVMMTRVRSQVIEGVREAIDALRPAEAVAKVLDEGIEGLGVSDSRAPFILDDNIPVVHFRDAETGEGIATMLSVANHPEALWSENPYLSADYVHFARKYISAGLPEVRSEAGELLKPALPGLRGVVVQFVGALGGLLNPGRGVARRYDGSEVSATGFEKADAIGQRVAELVLGAESRGELSPLTSAPGETPALRFASRKLLIPITNSAFLLAGFVLKLFARDIYNAVHHGGISFTPETPYVMSEIAVVKLGELTFMTAPGEVFSELLTGGYPGRDAEQSPTIGDVEQVRVGWLCNEEGLPAEGGALPCVVSATQENPPPWEQAPEGPYLYRYAGERPFFIGLGMDFLGYVIPEYDFQPGATGSHYEESNSASGEMTTLWREHLRGLLEALP